MVIAVVICGNRTTEALVMIKSAIIFRGNSDLRIVVVAEKHIQQEFDETVSIVLVGIRYIIITVVLKLIL